MRTSYFLLPLLVLTLPASAQSTPPAGMKHLSVSQIPVAPPVSVQPTPAPEPPIAVAPVKKPLSVEQALVKPDDLKDWSEIDKAVILVKPQDIELMIRQVEANPGSVPPTGLLFLAKALSDQKRMEEAALYFYIAQLRASFDLARWPPRLDPEDVERLQTENKKSPDQTGHTAGPQTPQIKNPHESVALLSSAISPPISQWLFEDPARAERVMAQVKAWDAAAPYAYLPGYDLPPPISFEDWSKVLQPTRDGFFARMDEFITGLKKLKPPAAR